MFPHAAVDHVDELDKALEEGDVDYQGIESILVGVGGSGKTHSLAMIFNEPVPIKRVSTTCVRTPVRTVTQIKIGEEQGVMKRVEGERYFTIVVDSAKEIGLSIQLASSHSRRPSRNDIPHYMRELEEEMHRRLYEKEDGEPQLLYKLRWIRLGQPQFLEILPIFIHHISLGIIVIKLNERLDCFPMMEFYNEEGESVGEPYKSCYSQWILLCTVLRPSLAEHLYRTVG